MGKDKNTSKAEETFETPSKEELEDLAGFKDLLRYYGERERNRQGQDQGREGGEKPKAKPRVRKPAAELVGAEQKI